MSEEMTTQNEQLSYSPQGLISQALAQNLPVETLERLMDLSDRWESKQAEIAYTLAMNKFQNDVPEIKRTKKGHNGKYADLAIIKKVIRPFLKENGLSYRWQFEESNDKIKCNCIVSHIKGHHESDSMVAGKDATGNKNDIQAIGSTRTYMQRYTLSAVLGLTTVDVDDDGESSTSGKKEPIPAPQEKKPAVTNDVNWGKLIKQCETTKALTALWNKMNPEERKTHIKTFSEIKANIEAEKNK